MLNPVGSRAYVANSNSNTVSVIDTASNTVVGTVPLGNVTPRAIAINPAGSRVYVATASSTSSNSVSVIDTASNTVVGTVPVGSSSNGIAVIR